MRGLCWESMVGKCHFSSMFWAGIIPRLAQSHISDAVLVAEGYVEVAVSIKSTAIEADVLVQSLEEKSTFVGGGFYFARHDATRIICVDSAR